MREVEWQIVVSRRAERTLRRLPKDILKRLTTAIDSLKENPRPSGCRKLVGEDLYRIRVGDWRIIYAIEDDKLLILIVKVAPRGSAYQE